MDFYRYYRDPYPMGLVVSWDNFWLDFNGTPFTAHTFPG